MCCHAAGICQILAPFPGNPRQSGLLGSALLFEIAQISVDLTVAAAALPRKGEMIPRVRRKVALYQSTDVNLPVAAQGRIALPEF